jgi:isopentenyl-diphosphate Delta-isomerase
MSSESIEKRKADHIQINLDKSVQSGLSAGFEKYQLPHEALPEIRLEDVNLEQTLFQKAVRAPILISSMTGGTAEALEINQNLAAAAQERGLPMGVGSQRAALENPSLKSSFRIRDLAPDILLFANLGAVQLNYGMTPDDCQAAVDMIDADGLILHLNPLQEAVQPEGETDFSRLAEKINQVCQVVNVPVIVKEVGWGISSRTARLLFAAGVAAVDVAGAGGTSWSEVEMHRSETEHGRRIASAFLDWGIPTEKSIKIVKKEIPDLLVFASGGIRSGVDIAKSIALGAVLAGMASPFLRAAADSKEAVLVLIDRIAREIQISMFASGVKNLDELQYLELLER